MRQLMTRPLVARGLCRVLQTSDLSLPLTALGLIRSSLVRRLLLSLAGFLTILPLIPLLQRP